MVVTSVARDLVVVLAVLAVLVVLVVAVGGDGVDGDDGGEGGGGDGRGGDGGLRQMLDRPVAFGEAGALRVLPDIVAAGWPWPLRSAALSPYQASKSPVASVVRQPRKMRS